MAALNSKNTGPSSASPTGVPSVVLALMLYEVAVQCRFVVYSYEKLRKAIEALDDESIRFWGQLLKGLETIVEGEPAPPAEPPSDDQQDAEERVARKRSLRGRSFFYAHALLTHTANISKIFWPDIRGQRRRFEARGKALRALIGLDDTSPLAGRDLRNALEHYDERVEDWASNVGGPISITDLTIGSPYWYAEWFDEEVENMHRMLDADAAVFSFLGVEQGLFDLIREIARVQRAVDGWLVEHVPGYEVLPITGW